METVVVTLSVLLNLFQLYQIFIFFKFIVCHDYEIKPFVIRYTIISLMELAILSYLISYTNQNQLSDKEQKTIISSFSIYILIKFSLILFQSFIQKRIRGHAKFRIYFFIMKLLKTFLTMNCLMTIFIERNQIEQKSEKYGLMIGVPLLLYGFFIGMNQLILFLRRKGVIKDLVKYPSSLCRKKQTEFNHVF